MNEATNFTAVNATTANMATKNATGNITNPRAMLELLQQAVARQLLRPLDVQFAYAMVADENPLLLLVTAYLSFETGAGHVCLPLERISPEHLFEGRHPELASPLWSLAGNPSPQQIISALQTCPAISDGQTPAPIILFCHHRSGGGLAGEYPADYRLYLQRMWQSERQVAIFFANNVTLADDINETQLRDILDELFVNKSSVNESNVNESIGAAKRDDIDWQKVAAAVAVTSRISVISGGPGTGKTTTVAKLLAVLLKLHTGTQLTIQLAAPTGKAAARLTESLSEAVNKLSLTDEQRRNIPEQAQTLHRLLGAQPESQKLRYHRDNPLSLDILVVDEASMVDLPMMARLIDALQPSARIIFLGDKDQLASVEAGAVLGDICRFAEQGYSTGRAAQLTRLTGCPLAAYSSSGSDVESATPEVRDCLCLLRKSYRFNAASGIGQLASAVNQGDSWRVSAVLKKSLPDVSFNPLAEDEDYQRLLIETAEKYQNYLRLVKERASPKTILAEFNRFRLLCALRDGPYGVSGLNQRVEQLLHHNGMIVLPQYSGTRSLGKPSLDKPFFGKPDLGKPDFGKQYLGKPYFGKHGAGSQYMENRGYAGRPIMILRNDSTLGLFNGDIGIMLRNQDNENQDNELKAYFQLSDGQIKPFQPSRLPLHETAYVMTVHKSQGSEFEHTALVLPDQFSPVVSRELVYTAVTRAREKLTLYARKAVLAKAVTTPTQRRSGLEEWFKR